MPPATVEVHERLLIHDDGEPLLQLDLVPRPNIVGLGVSEDTHRAAFDVTKSLRIVGSTTSWTGYQDGTPLDAAYEPVVARGWNARVGLHVDLPLGLELDAGVSENRLDSRYGSGRYRERSLSLSKKHRFSRWVTGFIALSIGQREWVGAPPVGESNDTHAMLTIGGTFR